MSLTHLIKMVENETGILTTDNSRCRSSALNHCLNTFPHQKARSFNDYILLNYSTSYIFLFTLTTKQYIETDKITLQESTLGWVEYHSSLAFHNLKCFDCRGHSLPFTPMTLHRTQRRFLYFKYSNSAFSTMSALILI